MQSIFAWHLGNPKPQTLSSKQIVKNIKLIDKTISKAAPKWSLDKINHIDLAVLRLAAWELLFVPQTPPKVVMDEAIEIAKEYGSESSSSFVNGVVGAIAKSLNLNLSSTKKATEVDKDGSNQDHIDISQT